MAGGISTIVDTVARALWVSHWKSEHENRAWGFPTHKLPWSGGEEPKEIAPETPWQAYVDAGRFVGVFEQLTGLQVDAAWAAALRDMGVDAESLNETETRLSKENFGHCLATGALWGKKDHGLKVPLLKPEYLPAVFSGVRCAGCHQDVGLDWDNCDICKRPTCKECLIPPPVGDLCHPCWSSRG